jgi:SAM-dependent methyltransferase
MVPQGVGSETLWEHLYRYRFAAQFVKGKDVLDVASGEGYGLAALGQAGAKSAIGVDISPEACRHANRKYGVDARQGDATKLPLSNDSIDLLVSFETIEHIQDPALFLDECARVMRPRGRIIVSTPNIETYNPDRSDSHNPFHCSEMSAAEFYSIIKERFTNLNYYCQRPTRASRWSFRSLTLIPSPWLKVRGYTRLSRYCQINYLDSELLARQDPVNAILKPEGWVSRYLNPYLVRKRNTTHSESPLYLLCTAELRK